MVGEPRATTWYLAQLKPNSVKIAEKNLRQQGFETFLPLEEVTRTRNSRFTTSKQPLVPGYLFVALDIAQGLWRKVNATYGVSRLVSFGGSPAAVPAGLVEHHRLRCNEEGAFLPQETFSPGDQVRIKTGPFSSILAEIESVSAEQRAWVLMDIMGGKSRVELRQDMLAAV